MPYTTCAVCNQNPLLLRAIYKYETLQQPELYQSCPPDEGNDIQPNKKNPSRKQQQVKIKKKEKSKKKTMPEIKLASKKQKLTQTINSKPNERTNDNIIQKENITSIQEEINLNKKTKIMITLYRRTITQVYNKKQT